MTIYASLARLDAPAADTISRPNPAGDAMTPEPDKSPRRRQTEAALMRAMTALQASGLAFGEIVIEGATIRILPKAETAPKDSARKPQAW